MITSDVLTIAPPSSSATLLLLPPIDTLPLPQLLLVCREQMARFQRGTENDPRFLMELFRRAIDAQDSNAWHALVDLYRPLLLARLRQRGVAPELAEEAVQETFVRLWLKSTIGAVSTYDHTLAQVLNYLWGSVRFALIKLRRQQRDVALTGDSDTWPLVTLIAGEVAVERVLDARALLARIRKLVTIHEWHILWLRFGQELPPREIATLLSVPVEQIHITLASTKRRLRSDSQLRQCREGESHS